MNTKLISAVVVLAVGGVFLLVSLNNKDENTSSGTQIMTETTETAESQIVTLPATMPANVPMYPGSVLKSSSETDQNGVKNITLSLMTTDSISDINTWYRGALKKDGWSVTDDRNVGGYVLLKGENANVATFMQAANAGDGTVTITQRIQIK